MLRKGGSVVRAKLLRRGRFVHVMAGVAVLLGALTLTISNSTAPAGPTCSAPAPGGPMLTLQREGDPKTPYARVQNLGRVRVVVK